MLERESQGFDLQEVWPPQQTININAQSVSGQFGVKSGAKAPEGMSVIYFNMKQLRKLVIDGFDDLSNAIEEHSLCRRQLYFLIGSWQGHQPDAIMGEKFSRFFSANVSFVQSEAESRKTA